MDSTHLCFARVETDHMGEGSFNFSKSSKVIVSNAAIPLETPGLEVERSLIEDATDVVVVVEVVVVIVVVVVVVVMFVEVEVVVHTGMSRVIKSSQHSTEAEEEDVESLYCTTFLFFVADDGDPGEKKRKEKTYISRLSFQMGKDDFWMILEQT